MFLPFSEILGCDLRHCLITISRSTWTPSHFKSLFNLYKTFIFTNLFRNIVAWNYRDIIWILVHFACRIILWVNRIVIVFEWCRNGYFRSPFCLIICDSRSCLISCNSRSSTSFCDTVLSLFIFTNCLQQIFSRSHRFHKFISLSWTSRLSWCSWIMRITAHFRFICAI